MREVLYFLPETCVFTFQLGGNVFFRNTEALHSIPHIKYTLDFYQLDYIPLPKSILAVVARPLHTAMGNTIPFSFVGLIIYSYRRENVVLHRSKDTTLVSWGVKSSTVY